MYKHLTTLILTIACCMVVAPLRTQAATSEHAVTTTLRIETVNGKTAYRTSAATLRQETWKVRQWRQVRFTQPWGDEHLRAEIWDDELHRLGTQGEVLPASTLDITRYDPTHYPALRLVVRPENSRASIPDAEVQFTYTESINARLLALIILVAMIFLALLIGTVRWRVSPRDVWHNSLRTIHHPLTSHDPATVISLGWAVVWWSALIAVPLGSFSNPVQVAYLFIKLPFLFLCTLLISAMANVVMAQLLGIRASVRDLVVHAVQTLALTVIGLAALSPILWWLRLTNQGHDVALLWAVGLFGLSFSLGVWRLWQQYGRFGSKWPFVPVLLWAGVYGFVLLQLGWMLRPWVGTIDPVSKTVPFSRLYSGNVFEEIISTINRL